MHPRLAELLAFTEQARVDLLSAVDGVAREHRERIPPSGGWSVADVLQHLHRSEDGSVRALFRAFRAAKREGLAMEQETSSLLRALDQFAVAALGPTIAAPEFTRPAEVLDAAEARARLGVSRAGLRTWAAEADGYALGSVRFPHPAIGEITLYEWVLMIGQHEMRHTHQVRRIGAELV